MDDAGLHSVDTTSRRLWTMSHLLLRHHLGWSQAVLPSMWEDEISKDFFQQDEVQPDLRPSFSPPSSFMALLIFSLMISLTCLILCGSSHRVRNSVLRHHQGLLQSRLLDIFGLCPQITSSCYSTTGVKHTVITSLTLPGLSTKKFLILLMATTSGPGLRPATPFKIF
jgi:hypothetical protein